MSQQLPKQQPQDDDVDSRYLVVKGIRYVVPYFKERLYSVRLAQGTAGKSVSEVLTMAFHRKHNQLADTQSYFTREIVQGRIQLLRSKQSRDDTGPFTRNFEPVTDPEMPTKPQDKFRIRQHIHERCTIYRGPLKVIWNSSDTEGSYRAIFKPAGLPVINDEGDCHGCVSGLVKRRDETYELGHRLDLPVSGVLLLGKGGKRALRLIKALGPEEKEQGKVLKAYLARVRVAVQEGSGDIGGGALCLDDADWQNMKEIRVKLRWDNRVKKASVVDSSSDGLQEGDRNTITRVQKLKWDASKGEGLLRVELVTGARQQVRAVLANMGLPIIGDTKYGGGPMFVPTPKQTQPPPTSAAADFKEDQVQQSELRLYADDEKGCLLEMLRREKVDWCDKCRWQMEEASKGGTRQGADSLADSICLLSYHYRIPNLGIDVQLPDNMLPDWARS